VRARLEEADHILLIRLRSLGDSILTLPLIEALHRWRTGLKLSILIESPFSPVFDHHPALHEVIVLRNKKAPAASGLTRLQGLLRVRRRRFPAVLNLHGGTTSLIFALASGAPLRIGQETYRLSRCYNARIPASSLVWGRAHLHTVEHQLTLMRWLGLPVAPEISPRIHVADDARVRMEARLGSAGLRPGAYILIQPTATLFTKQWPEENFAQLADRLSQAFDLPVVFSAGPGETETSRRIELAAHQRHHYWSDLDLEGLFALIEGCRLFIGNDSGPTHAAAALNKPIVVIWGSSDFDVWHPWNARHESIRSALPCMPCPGYSCAVYGKPRCILDISVEPVFQASARMLKDRGQATLSPILVSPEIS